MSIDRVFQQLIKDNFNSEYQLGLSALSKAGLLIGNKIKIIFEIGNHYQLVKNCKKIKNGYTNDKWWTAFVRLKNAPEGLNIDKIVKHCFFELHPDFKVNDHKVKVKPQMIDTKRNIYSKPGEISLSKKGWGYFDMPIEVHFKDELNIKPIKINHELEFEAGGKWN